MPAPLAAIRWTGRQGVWILLAASFGLRLALAALMPPGYDEVYYFFYGRHIDLSFYDHPLAVGVWSWLGQRLGPSVLALRLPSVLSYTLALGLLGQATARWFGPRARLWLLLLGNLCPLVLICGGVLLLPDSPLLLGLALLLWWIAREPQVLPRGPGQMLALASILALITLSKYHALVVLPALLVWTLVRPDSRRLWLRWTSLGTVLAWALLVSPLWLWNSRWGWVSFLFHSGRTTASAGFNAEGSLLFLLSQLGLLFPTIGILLLAVLWPWRRAGALASAPAQLLRCLAWPQLVLFVLLAGRMQVMTSWLVPAWWISLPLAAAWLAQRPWGLPAGSRGLRRSAWITAVVVPPLLLFGGVQMRWGVLERWLPTASDPSAQLMAPADLQRALRRHPRIWQALQQADVIASFRYEMPGFLALALGNSDRVAYTTLSDDPRGFAFWPAPTGASGRGVLFAPVEPGLPLVRRSFPAPIGALQPLGEVVVERNGQPAVRLEFASFERQAGPYPWPYGNR